MELFHRLFAGLLLFVYHCFDRIVINGYLSALTRPENAVYFFREVLGVGAITKEVLRQRTDDYHHWVDAYARKRNIPMEWAEKGVRKEDYVRPWLRRMERQNQHGVYFIFKSLEQGQTFRSVLPKFPTADFSSGNTRSSLPSFETRFAPTTWQTSGLKRGSIICQRCASASWLSPITSPDTKRNGSMSMWISRSFNAWPSPSR